MIARLLASAVLALPLVAGSQAPRAGRANPQNRADQEAPLVRVWIPGAWSFRYGEPVRVSFEVSEASHVAVVRIDGNGRLSVLWPTSRNLQTAARPGHEYRVSGPYTAQAAFHADYEVSSGMVIAIASYDPIDLTAFRRYRNDQSYFRNVQFQQPYYGGVRHVVDRISQEILYAADSPYDYDVAFYNVLGRGMYTNASNSYCLDDYYGYSRHRQAAYYWSSIAGWPASAWNDCYASFYHAYFAHCASWAALSGYAWCRQWNPNWPVPPAPTPQPQTPTVNISMIDTIMARPVDKYPVISGNPTSNGTTHIVTMEPAREPPNVTRWLPDDDNAAISIPRLRRSSQEGATTGGRINTRDEGYRSPGTGFRTDEPRVADSPIDRGAFMPPVRQPPREPTVWRDNDRVDHGSNHFTPQRWERPTSSEPRNPGASAGSGVDRGTTTSSPAPTVTPRTDATVTKTSEPPKSSEPPKGSGERKPQ